MTVFPETGPQMPALNHTWPRRDHPLLVTALLPPLPIEWCCPIGRILESCGYTAFVASSLTALRKRARPPRERHEMNLAVRENRVFVQTGICIRSYNYRYHTAPAVRFTACINRMRLPVKSKLICLGKNAGNNVVDPNPIAGTPMQALQKTKSHIDNTPWYQCLWRGFA
jgi:hypothetical protein